MYDCCRVETAIIHNERKKTCNIAGVQLDTVQTAVDRDEGVFDFSFGVDFLPLYLVKKTDSKRKRLGLRQRERH